MAIQGNKIMSLEDGQVLYNDLRRRIEKNAGVIEEVINTPLAVQTFDDGADGLPMALTVGIEPVQDLHGLDNPYPGGGGKNLLPCTLPYTTYGSNGLTGSKVFDADGNAIGIKISGTNNTEYSAAYLTVSVLYLAAGTYMLTGGKSTEKFIRIGSVSSASDNAPAQGTFVLQDIGSGATITVSTAGYYNFSIGITTGTTVTNEEFKPMLRLSSVSDATFAPYSNICPISGWTGAKVTRTGKNLFNIDTITHLKGIDENSGIANSSASCVSDYISVKGNTEYYLTCRDDGGSRRVGFYDKDKNPLPASSSAIGSRSFTTPSNAFYCRVSVSDTYSSETQVEFGSSGSTIAEYKGNEYTLTFPTSAGTVYGGTLTVNKDGSGELVVDRASVDLGTLNWDSGIFANNKRGFLSNVNTPSGIKPVSSSSVMADLLCTKYPTLTGDLVYRCNLGISMWSTQARVSVYDPACESMTSNELKAAMSGVQLVYKIATPVTYSLTPGQVKTLLGVNNIFADCGNITDVRYPADTKLYVDQQIADKIYASQRLMELIVTANHEDDMKATKAYSKDELLIVNGTLYKATASIANGANLTVNTNVTATTVAAELAALV